MPSLHDFQPAVDEVGLSIAQRKCKPLACAIQACLKRKQYNEKRCAFEIDSWRRCVEAASKADDEVVDTDKGLEEVTT